jgi:hypothetical protein
MKETDLSKFLDAVARRAEAKAIEANVAEVQRRIDEVFARARAASERIRLERSIVGRMRLRWRRFAELVSVHYDIARLERRIKLAQARVVKR